MTKSVSLEIGSLDMPSTGDKAGGKAARKIRLDKSVTQVFVSYTRDIGYKNAEISETRSISTGTSERTGPGTWASRPSSPELTLGNSLTRTDVDQKIGDLHPV